MLASERRLAQSIANYNVSVADLYPRLSINGSIGFAASNFSSLSDSGNEFFSFGPSISWAIFDRTKLNAVVRANDAVTRASLAEFEQTVLIALEEVRSSMTVFTQQEQRRESLRLAALAADKATKLARERFRVGIDNYIDVLDAERTLLETEDQLALSESQVLIDLISIYKALGGGWQLAID